MKKRLSILMTCILLFAFAAGCAGKNSSSEVNVPVEDVVQSIREAYGEDYLAIMEIPVQVVEAEFGLTEDLYEEILAEGPMMTVHPDRVVIVKAVPGKADEVEALLRDARENKINSELQYPMNIPKTNAAKVVRNGNYVAFLLVGAPLDNMEATEAEAADYFEDQVQKAVDAFNNALKQ